MTLQLHLTKYSFTTFVSAYSPILDSSDDVKIAFATPCIPPSERFHAMTRSYCWAIAMPGSAEVMTCGKVSLVIMVLAT